MRVDNRRSFETNSVNYQWCFRGWKRRQMSLGLRSSHCRWNAARQILRGRNWLCWRAVPSSRTCCRRMGWFCGECFFLFSTTSKNCKWNQTEAWTILVSQLNTKLFLQILATACNVKTVPLAKTECVSAQPASMVNYAKWTLTTAQTSIATMGLAWMASPATSASARLASLATCAKSTSTTALPMRVLMAASVLMT